MKKLKLSKEEEQILQQIETGDYVADPNFTTDKNTLRQAAKNSLDKNKNINVRLSMRDLQLVKFKAAQNGIPYQTLITTIVHQYATGKIAITL